MLVPITCGCILIIFGAFELLVYIMNKKYFKQEIIGTVIRLEMNKSQALPVYSYIVNGIVYKTTLIPELYDKSNFTVGQEDTLLYHAENPEQIKLKKESYLKVYALFGGSIVVGIIIITLTLCGIIKT